MGNKMSTIAPSLLQTVMSQTEALAHQARYLGIRIDEASLRDAEGNPAETRYLLQEAGLDLTSSGGGGAVGFALPCSCELVDGKWITVLARKGGTFVVADPDAEGAARDIDATDFAVASAGRCLVLRKSLDRVAHEQSAPRALRHWFWSRVTSRSVPIGNILLASLVANLLATVASLFALQVYDRVIPNQSEDTLLVLLLGVGAALILEALLRIARANVLDQAGRDVDIEASADLLRKLMQLRLGAGSPRASRLSQLMREFGSIREFVTEAAVGALADIPFAFLFLLLIYWISGPVVAVPALAMVLMIVPPILAKKRMLRIAGKSLGAQTAAGRIINEVAYGLETVKISRGERFFSAQWEDTSRLISNASEEQRRLSAKLTQWAASVQQSAHALTVTACVYQVFAGNMTVGAIIATTLLMSRALSPMARFSTVLMRWHQVKTSLEGLDSIVNAETDAPADTPKLPRSTKPGRLAAETLTFHFEEKAPPVLDIRELRIAPGERVALLGQNGSGKSTLLRCLSGVHTPTSGLVSIDRMDIRQIDTRDLRRAIGYLPQDTVLFNGTLRDNLSFRRPDLGDDAIHAALDCTGLGTFVKGHPAGLDMRIHDGGAGLSVGQRQSVGLARLMLADPGNVLLDEPTASFDPTVESDVIERLADWIDGRTFVVATHRMPILRLVSRVIVMQRGRIALDGPRDDVMARISAAQGAVLRTRDDAGNRKIAAIRNPREPAATTS